MLTTRSARPATAVPVATGAGLSALVMGWVTIVLVLDAHGSLWQQRALGLLTWAVLAWVLSREVSLVRAQTLVVVGFATAVEYTCSPLLHVYLYRFHNVPAYVPPGHGLVYLAALGIGRSRFVRSHLRRCLAAVVATGGAYALWGVTLSPRLDVLGVFWFGCLLGFIAWGPSKPLYVGAFVVVTYLEILGTSVGTWAWQTHDPTGLVAIGNPPSGAAGGYGWFDLAALAAAPSLLAGWHRATARSRSDGAAASHVAGTAAAPSHVAGTAAAASHVAGTAEADISGANRYGWRVKRGIREQSPVASGDSQRSG